MSNTIDIVEFHTLSIEQQHSVLDIEAACHIHPWSAKSFNFSKNNQSISFAILDKHTVIGYLILMIIDIGAINNNNNNNNINIINNINNNINDIQEYELLNITISKSYQSYGFGNKLLLYTINYIYKNYNSNNKIKVFLEVRQSNLIAINLYTKTGFKIVGQRKNYYPTQDITQRENAYIMCLETNK